MNKDRDKINVTSDERLLILVRTNPVNRITEMTRVDLCVSLKRKKFRYSGQTHLIIIFIINHNIYSIKILLYKNIMNIIATS